MTPVGAFYQMELTVNSVSRIWRWGLFEAVLLATGSVAHASLVFAPQIGGTTTLTTGTPSGGIRPFGVATPPTSMAPVKTAGTGDVPKFTNKDLPAPTGSASALCTAGSPGCTHPIGQGDPLNGAPLIEPPSMAPKLVAPGPTRFEHDVVVPVGPPTSMETAPVRPHPTVFRVQIPFAFGRATVTPPERQRIIALAQRGDFSSLGEVTVVAYTDSLGSDAANRRLAHLRAQAVAEVLIHAGVPASRVYLNTHERQGEIVAPAACVGSLQQQAACQAPNRRVVITASGQSTEPSAPPTSAAMQPWSPVVQDSAW